jgi:nitrate reductase beta subunit
MACERRTCRKWDQGVFAYPRKKAKYEPASGFSEAHSFCLGDLIEALRGIEAGERFEGRA